ncbi:MAG: hypothetical protein JWR26_4543 [Pedosphaera sp.]|nr:hypothetical protein [Pedosphaera sp.]
MLVLQARTPGRFRENMVRSAGFEPTTVCLEGRCSIQLSYERPRIDFSEWKGLAQVRVRGGLVGEKSGNTLLTGLGRWNRKSLMRMGTHSNLGSKSRQPFWPLIARYVSLAMVATAFALFARPAPPSSRNLASERPLISEIATNYTNFNKITKTEAFVSREFYMRCSGASPEMVEAMRKQELSAASVGIFIYMNNLAADAFGRNDACFPVGAVVVKRKTIQGHADSFRVLLNAGNDGYSGIANLTLGYGSTLGARDNGRIGSFFHTGENGVGGMVKRAPGYDPAHGDWEYFYFDDAAKIQSGRIASCVGCHETAKGKDYVFGTWKN